MLAEPEWLQAQVTWQRVYGHAFRGRPRLRRGVKAEHEYHSQACDHYLIVPLPSGVSELPTGAYRRTIGGYECQGPLVELGEFYDAEFLVGPPNMACSMVNTHEDHAFGGPYFIRAAWIPRVIR